MTEQSETKKLAFLEVLVVVLVCLFILAILLLVGHRYRANAFRVECGKNLFEIGKAIRVYAADHDDELPHAGGRNSVWINRIPQWLADNRFGAYGLSADGSGGMANITSSFYLLVKYAGVSPKTFVCPGDRGTSEFRPADEGVLDRELIYLWDFGPEPIVHCSYSYHMPYGRYPLTASSELGMAVAADRNPWINSPAADAKSISFFNPDGGREAVKAGNAIAHQEDGQNVLFLDIHVGFEKRPHCAINDDNIYTYWDGGDIRRGGMPLASEPMDRLDSFLVNEGGGGSPIPLPPMLKNRLLQEEAAD